MLTPTKVDSDNAHDVSMPNALTVVRTGIGIHCLYSCCTLSRVRDGPKRGRTIDVYGFSSFIIVAGKTTL